MRRADTVSNAVRISTDVYGCVRRRGTWCSECHVLLYFYSTWLRVLLAGKAHCAEPILRARPTGNTGNTKNTGVSTRKRVSHVPWNFRSTWLTVYHRPSIVFPVFIVFPVGFAPAMRLAQCALPAAGNTLCFLVNAMHMAHGGKPHFSPCPPPPFRPCVV